MNTFIIIDTNVVVAGLLTGHADSPVARILDGMLSASFPFIVSEALLAEYREVLVRSKVILTDMARHAIVLTPVSAGLSAKAPGAGDQFLWDLLATRDDLVLLTGDKLLLKDKAMQQRVILTIWMAHIGDVAVLSESDVGSPDLTPKPYERIAVKGVANVHGLDVMDLIYFVNTFDGFPCSCRAMVGRVAPQPWLHVQWLMSQFGNTPQEAIAAYFNHVRAAWICPACEKRWVTSFQLTTGYRACNDAPQRRRLPCLQPCRSATWQSGKACATAATA